MITLLWLLSLISLVVGYNSTNPLTSALCLILALVLVSPLLTILTYSWYVYVLLLLFLSGILVLVVYFSSLSTFTFKIVKGGSFFVILTLLYPWVVDFTSSSNIFFLFLSLNCVLLIYLISVLILLMLFSSYFLSYSAAIRRL